jgi:acyl carrier protein
MDGDSTQALRTRLIELVERLLAQRSVGRTISADDPLTEVGVDSLGLVNLMLAIEAEFDILIAPGDITPENLRSVATIEALIARHGPVASA